MPIGRIKDNLLYDIRNGCRKNIIIYFCTVLFAALSAYTFGRMTDNYIYRGILEAEPGAADYLVYLFGGAKIIKESSEFQIPILWMTIQVLTGLYVYIYPVDLLDGGSLTVLIQSGSKTGWWLSKCIWSVLQVVILYGIIFVSAAIFGVFYGSGLQYHSEISAMHAKVIISNIKLLDIVLLAAPFLYSVTAALIQVNLSIFIGPVNSFIFVMAYHVISIYGNSFIFLGSVSMIYRNKGLTGEGVDWILLLIICGCISIAAVITGALKFRHSDLLGRKNW